jgi:hypothetical protein
MASGCEGGPALKSSPMRTAHHLVAIVAALLQLALPLSAYARAPAPFVPGEADLCSAVHSRRADGPAAPAPTHHHGSSHCALCAHGAPPALVASPLLPPAVATRAIRVFVARDFAPPAVAHARADARAPPLAAHRTT